jgi:hypothetical protein
MREAVRQIDSTWVKSREGAHSRCSPGIRTMLSSYLPVIFAAGVL